MHTKLCVLCLQRGEWLEWQYSTYYVLHHFDDAWEKIFLLNESLTVIQYKPKYKYLLLFHIHLHWVAISFVFGKLFGFVLFRYTCYFENFRYIIKFQRSEKTIDHTYILFASLQISLNSNII